MVTKAPRFSRQHPLNFAFILNLIVGKVKQSLISSSGKVMELVFIIGREIASQLSYLSIDSGLLLSHNSYDNYFSWSHYCSEYIQKTKEVIQMLTTPREKGQGLVEYALILVMVALVVIVALALLGPAIGQVFSNLIPLL